VLRRIFGPKRGEVTGEWRELHNKELYALSSVNIIRVKPEGRRQLARPRRRWEDNIKMDLRESGWGGIDWIDLAQDRDRWRAVVNKVMNFRVP
jgi:hypothetical protein